MHREGIGNYTACQSIWRMTVQGGHLECVYSFWRSSISAGKADVSTCLHIWSGAVKILQQLIISGDLLQVLWCVLIKFGVKNKLSWNGGIPELKQIGMQKLRCSHMWLRHYYLMPQEWPSEKLSEVCPESYFSLASKDIGWFLSRSNLTVASGAGACKAH